jgi:copper chaperone CopZ
MSITRRFDVTGMTCGGCERALGRAVSRVPGVQDVSASHADRVAIVTYDEGVTTPEAIAAAIRQAGYEPNEAA